jgi:hypothetical protein
MTDQLSRRQALALFAAPAPTTRYDPRRKFVGAWRLAHAEVVTGTRKLQHPYGKHAAGRIIYEAGGHMSVQIMGDDGAYGSFFGTYEVDENAGVVAHTIEGSSQPRHAGTMQRRRFRFSSDTMTLEGEGPEGRTITVWQRLRPR